MTTEERRDAEEVEGRRGDVGRAGGDLMGIALTAVKRAGLRLEPTKPEPGICRECAGPVEPMALGRFWLMGFYCGESWNTDGITHTHPEPVGCQGRMDYEDWLAMHCRARLGPLEQRMRLAGFDEGEKRKRRLLQYFRDTPLLELLGCLGEEDAPTMAYVYGDYGTGKTSQLAAVCRTYMNLGYKVRYVRESEIFESLRPKDTGGDKRTVEYWASFDLLCIDEVGEDAVTKWSGGVLAKVIDAYYNSGKPLVMASNYCLDELAANPHVGRRAVDRIQEAAGVIGPERRRDHMVIGLEYSYRHGKAVPLPSMANRARGKGS